MTGAYIARAETRVIQPPFYYFPGEYTCNAINVDVFEPDGTMRTTVDVMATLAIPGGKWRVLGLPRAGSLAVCAAWPLHDH